MSDDADRAGDNTDRLEADAIKAISEASKRRSLLPIIQEMDGTRFGVCHYCESPIKPGRLFCDTDTEEPDKSCAFEWEHEHNRRKATGL